MTKPRRCAIAFVISIAVLAAALVCLPRFLLYSSDVEKAEAIVLLLGHDFSARKKEVRGLTSEGLAGYLIIPAYNKMTNMNTAQEFKTSSNFTREVRSDYWLSRIYENTHLELIEARITMDEHNIQSAIFVSSPYHMRRIKIITSKVFAGQKTTFYFVPTRYEQAPSYFWRLTLSDWKNVLSEYFKIVWFIVYVNFLQS